MSQRHGLIVGIHTSHILPHRSEVTAGRIYVLISAEVRRSIIERSLRVIVMILVAKMNAAIAIVVSCGRIALILLNMANRRTMEWVCTRRPVRFLPGIVLQAIHALLAVGRV